MSSRYSSKAVDTCYQGLKFYPEGSCVFVGFHATSLASKKVLLTKHMERNGVSSLNLQQQTGKHVFILLVVWSYGCLATPMHPKVQKNPKRIGNCSGAFSEVILHMIMAILKGDPYLIISDNLCNWCYDGKSAQIFFEGRKFPQMILLTKQSLISASSSRQWADWRTPGRPNGSTTSNQPRW